MAITAVTGFVEPFKNTHPYYRYGYVNATRTATGSGAGTQTAGLAFGGDVPPSTNATEEFTGAFLSVKKVTLT